MENEKIFSLIEKMYSDILGRFDKIENNLNGIKDESKKNSIDIEEIKVDIKTLAEIQQSHFEQNQRNHQEIVETLSDKVSTVEKAIVNNIKAIK